MDYDTNSPGVQGIDTDVLLETGYNLSVTGRAGIAQLRSTVSETVTDIWAYFKTVIGTLTGRLDIYDKAALAQVPSVQTDRPDADKSISGTYASTSGGTLFDDIDEPGAVDGAYVYCRSDGTDDVFQNSLLFSYVDNSPGAGTWAIASIEVHSIVEVTGAAASDYSSFGSGLYVTDGDGISWQSIASSVINEMASVPGNVAQREVTQIFTEMQKSSDATVKRGITVDDYTRMKNTVGDLTSGVYNQMDIRTATPGVGTVTNLAEVRLHKHWLIVNYVLDPRIISETFSLTAAGWVEIPLAPTWNKVLNKDYLYVFHKTDGTGAAVLGAIEVEGTPPGLAGAFEVELPSSGILDATLPDMDSRFLPVMMEVGGAAVVDSQPYAGMGRQTVDITMTVFQEFTAETTANRSWAGFRAASSRFEIPAAPLTVELMTTAGGLLATAVIPAHAVEDGPYIPKTLDAIFDVAPNLVNGTEYRLRFICTAAAGEGWDILYLDSKVAPISGDARGFAGVGGSAFQNGVANDDLDFAVRIGTDPGAPTGFTATPEGSGRNLLAWTPTALIASFYRYLLFREDADGYWDVISHVWNEGVDSYIDKGARTGVSENYCMAVQRTDGSISLRSNEDSAIAAGNGRWTIIEQEHRDVPGMLTSISRPLTTRIEQAADVAFRYGGDIMPIIGPQQGRTLAATLHVQRSIMLAPRPLSLFDDQLEFLGGLNQPYGTLLTPDGERAFIKARVSQTDLQVPHYGTISTDLYISRTRPIPVAVY